MTKAQAFRTRRTAGVLVLTLATCSLAADLATRAADTGSPAASSAAPAGKDLKLKNLRVGKILFLGNSITQHGPKPEIGWTGNWGMAASALDKDYPHVLAARVGKAAGGEPQILARNIADFERGHPTYDIAAGMKDELAFQARRGDRGHWRECSGARHRRGQGQISRGVCPPAHHAQRKQPSGDLRPQLLLGESGQGRADEAGSGTSRRHLMSTSAPWAAIRPTPPARNATSSTTGSPATLATRECKLWPTRCWRQSSSEQPARNRKPPDNSRASRARQRMKLTPCLLLALAGAMSRVSAAAEPQRADVVVVAATPGGVAAAVAAARSGASVILVEEGQHVGGIISAGLTNTDIRRHAAVGGLYNEFKRRVRKYYIGSYGPDSVQVRLCQDGNRFEPKVAERMFREMLAGEERIRLVERQRVVATRVVDADGVERDAAPGRRIEGSAPKDFGPTAKLVGIVTEDPSHEGVKTEFRAPDIHRCHLRRRSGGAGRCALPRWPGKPPDVWRSPCRQDLCPLWRS